ncbi:GNAT family protein [soil metagenome]
MSPTLPETLPYIHPRFVGAAPRRCYGAPLMEPPEHLHTERLRLRPATVTDATALFDAYASDPQATRYLSWRTHETVDETREFLADAQARWHEGSEFIWVLVPRASGASTHDDDRSGAPIGAIGAAITPHGVEIGYVLGAVWWGRGLARDALTAVMRWLQSQPEVFRVWAYCAVDHLQSARVLERSGMTYEGTLRRWVVLPNLADEPCDAWVYSWVRTDR